MYADKARLNILVETLRTRVNQKALVNVRVLPSKDSSLSYHLYLSFLLANRTGKSTAEQNEQCG